MAAEELLLHETSGLGGYKAAARRMNSNPTAPTDDVTNAAVRVLLAEDEALIALSLADLLEADGYDVTLASDGAKALARARELGAALDVLLTDLNMPEMSGEALIKALRTDRPGLPVVVVTGSPPFGGAEELQRLGGGYGPLALLQKPINYTELLDALRNCVGLRST